MIYPFFVLAAQSPTRQGALRKTIAAHLLVLAPGFWAIMGGIAPVSTSGDLLLLAGIVEGAALIGWRLTQLPRSQALEFVLVTPLRPEGVLVAETLVGLARLGIVTLSGLPLLSVLVWRGHLEPIDLVPLLVMSFTWGGVTGLALATWAFEPRPVRRWIERIAFGMVVLYLAIGVMAGERLQEWVDWIPGGAWLFTGFVGLHRYNPFTVMRAWFSGERLLVGDLAVGLEVAAVFLLMALLARAASRLRAHFHERHYGPARDVSQSRRGAVGDRPLSWWAVRRVREYSGRINLWLAGGFGCAYAAYTVAGPHWPAWMGRGVFTFFDHVGGIPVLTTALVILAAVPAAFQYGLWDSTVQDRCRRLELLLLTGLDASDYWKAAASAAWQRGRGYFGVAVLLWTAATFSGRMGVTVAVAALAAAVVLWGLYFTLGFRAFSSGLHTNSLGLILTVGLPLAVYGGYRGGWRSLAALLPPGTVFATGAGGLSMPQVTGLLLAGVLALILAPVAMAQCDGKLRRWYDQHQGEKAG
jgi:hypothetical protein